MLCAGVVYVPLQPSALGQQLCCHCAALGKHCNSVVIQHVCVNAHNHKHRYSFFQTKQSNGICREGQSQCFVEL